MERRCYISEQDHRVLRGQGRKVLPDVTIALTPDHNISLQSIRVFENGWEFDVVAEWAPHAPLLDLDDLDAAASWRMRLLREGPQQSPSLLQITYPDGQLAQRGRNPDIGPVGVVGGLSGMHRTVRQRVTCFPLPQPLQVKISVEDVPAGLERHEIEVSLDLN